MKKTIVGVFKQRVNELGGRPALGHKVDGVWVKQSWREWWEQAERVAAALMAAGVERGARVAVLSESRVEWAWINLGVAMAGAVIVPVYPVSTAEDCRQIFKASAARVAFVADPIQLQKILSVHTQLDELEQLVYFNRTALGDGFASTDGSSSERRLLRVSDLAFEFDENEENTQKRRNFDDWIISFEAFIARGRHFLGRNLDAIARRRRQVRPEDPAGIFYTAGTTGPARGVVHTHQTLVSAVTAFLAPGLLSSQDRQLIFLPMARLFAQILFYAGIFAGAEAIFAERMERALGDFHQTNPTFVGVVPRVLQTIYDHLFSPDAVETHTGARVWHAAAISGLEVDGTIFNHAMRRGRYFSQLAQTDRVPNRLQKLEQRVYSRLVFRRIRALFGSDLRYIFCGGAPLDPLVTESFHAAGLVVLESYGLTEAGAIATLNLPGHFRSGSAGRALPGVDLTIAPDGEILVRGPMLADGYLPQTNGEHSSLEKIEPISGNAGRGDPGSAGNEEDWFHTGDLGHFDLDGFLYVTGRKKHLIATQLHPADNSEAPGEVRRVLPEQIELELQRAGLIARVVVYSDEPDDPGASLRALVTLNEAAETWAIQRGISFESRADLAGQGEIRDELARVFDAYNQQAEPHLRVESFKILAATFTREADELTATGKLRRDRILARYARNEALNKGEASK